MTIFNAEQFFDLHDIFFQELLTSSSYLWEAIFHIKTFLKTLPQGQILSSYPTSGVYFKNPETIFIGENTHIEPGVYIEGPCYIGNRCHIRHGAYIRGHVITGDGCVIGHATEIKDTILLHEAKAPHFAYVSHSILGNRVNLGAGVKCANLKLNRTSVTINYDGKKYDTQQRKLGAIIGDDCQLGCNSVTNPGTVLGKKVFCRPNTTLSGVIFSRASFSKSSRT